jgi:predicted ferric reductase
VLLGVGVIRRWRWTFWLVAVAFILGVLRVPASILQFVGLLSADGPAWYTLLQALLGLVQFAIGLAMLAGYRRSGVWGSF